MHIGVAKPWLSLLHLGDRSQSESWASVSFGNQRGLAGCATRCVCFVAGPVLVGFTGRKEANAIVGAPYVDTSQESGRLVFPSHSEHSLYPIQPSSSYSDCASNIVGWVAPSESLADQVRSVSSSSRYWFIFHSSHSLCPPSSSLLLARMGPRLGLVRTTPRRCRTERRVHRVASAVGQAWFIGDP